MGSVMFLYFSTQEEDILEHTTVMASVICVHFIQLVDHCVT